MADQNDRTLRRVDPPSRRSGPGDGGPPSGRDDSRSSPGDPPSGFPDASWQVQEAKARFSELLEASLAEGPQIITRRGVEIAAVVPIDQWRRLESTAPSLKDWLLEPDADAEVLTLPRRRLHLRPVQDFE